MTKQETKARLPGRSEKSADVFARDTQYADARGERLAAVESSAKQAHHRLDRIEEKTR